MYVLRAMCLCLAVVVVSSDNSSNTSTRLTEEMYESCVAETKISQDDQRTLSRNGVLQTQSQKCMAGCLFRKTNLINNGKLLEEVLNEKYANDLYGKNQTNVIKAKSINHVCIDKAQSMGTEECTLAANYLYCFFEEAKKVGLPAMGEAIDVRT